VLFVRKLLKPLESFSHVYSLSTLYRSHLIVCRQ
jgi:hypothetical protein